MGAVMLPITAMALRLSVSAVLGGLIGMEREAHRHEAGLRTHILVCVGSSLIMLTSMHIFDIYKDSAIVDPSRLAANVVTGMGFIGAGAIIRYGMAVKGLTTASSLWITSAVGLAIGCGYYEAGIFATVISLATLLFLRSYGKDLFLGRNSKQKKGAKHGDGE